MSIRNMRLGGTAAPRAIAAGLLSLLAVACVRHLPVVGETEGKEPAAHAGAGGRASASAPAARRPASEQSAQRASAAGTSGEEEEEASEPPAPSAGKSGGTPAASPRAEAGASAQMDDKADKAEKAGAAAPEPSSAQAGSGAAPPSMPSMPSTPGSSATPGTGWYCAQASNVCSCVEGSGVSGDTCTSHPTCCFEASSGTNGTMYRSCFCVADGSPECTAYTMTVAQGFKKASSCPL